MEFGAVYPLKSNSSGLAQESYNTEWTKQDNKTFECALALYDKDNPDRWLKVAANMIPGKTLLDVVKHYRKLEQDITEIEAGRVPDPEYPSSSFTFEHAENRVSDKCRKRPATAVKSSDQERKKVVPWTVDEHIRFLMGLTKCDKGDWRTISRMYVVTRSPTQVASHAQKYFLRQSLPGGKKNNKRRHSIHDITVASLVETCTSNANQPLPFNEPHIPAPQQNLMTSMPQVQQGWINHHHNGGAPMGFNANGDNFFGWTNHHNDGALMGFNPNGGNIFEPSSSGISPNTLNLQGQDLHACGFHEAYANNLNTPGMASEDFNKEAGFGIHDQL